MGKAAKNESLKLSATYYNNISIAIVVAGTFVPLYSAFGFTFTQAYAWLNGLNVTKAIEAADGAFNSVISIFLAIAISRIFHHRALEFLQGLED